MSEPHTGTILLVDDESVVRDMTEMMLTRNGYSVIAACSGEEAIRLLSEKTDLQVDLALVDVVMPDMSGPEVADALRRIRTGLPVLFITGYADQLQILQERKEHVVRKPFTSVTLIRRLREMLDMHEATEDS